MDRRQFVKQGCILCVATGIGLSMLTLNACTTVHYISGNLAQGNLEVPISEFEIKANTGETKYRSYIVVKHESLQYPVCVYRFSKEEFSAIWLKCSHQGAELQVAGDTLVCQAHGSEFNNKGAVTGGPAEQNLRTFKTFVQDKNLMIVLS